MVSGWAIAVTALVGAGVAIVVSTVESVRPHAPATTHVTAEQSSAPVELTIWQRATLDTINDANRRGEIALRQGDHAQACVQGQLQVAGWLELAGSLPKGSSDQELAEATYRKMTDSVRTLCGF